MSARIAQVHRLSLMTLNIPPINISRRCQHEFELELIVAQAQLRDHISFMSSFSHKTSRRGGRCERKVT
jgi:hypothetical protein